MSEATLFAEARRRQAASAEPSDLAGTDLGPLQLVTALACAAVFGVALGAPFGAVSMAIHAAAVPLGFVLITLLAVPAFYVGLAHAGVELDLRALALAVVAGDGHCWASAGRAGAGDAAACRDL